MMDAAQHPGQGCTYHMGLFPGDLREFLVLKLYGVHILFKLRYVLSYSKGEVLVQKGGYRPGYPSIFAAFGPVTGIVMQHSSLPDPGLPVIDIRHVIGMKQVGKGS